MTKRLLLLAIFFSYLSCSENPVEPNIFPNGGFEVGSLYGWQIEAARDSSIILLNKPVYEGRFAVKLTLFPGDIVSSGHRVELSRPYCAEYQTEMVYSWVFKIDENFVDNDKKYLIHQFHDYPDFLNGETWETMTVYPPPVFTSYLKDTVYIYSHSIEHGVKIIGKRAIIKGQWTKIKYIIKWSLNNDGYIEAYIEGTPVTHYNGIDYKFFTPTLYNKMGNFFKFGLYTDPAIVDTNSIYLDDLIITFR